uniref:Uncharacterized protein TCIL3000_10_1660 n=1 Tax=Trypanosoma congolense (strain IL3000) TaxID=1068625 RepID=G0UVJ1_TRYCI|nr:unnamed protein product [Trypanosoma congolense IL3000]
MSNKEFQRNLRSLQFLIFDKNSDGCIKREQLGSLLRCWGFCPTDAEVQASAELLDPDNTGFIGKTQALDMAETVGHQKKLLREVHLREALRVLDVDADGYLSTTELRSILLNMGAKITKEEADEVIGDAFVDEDKQINTDEFARLLLSNLSFSEALLID